LQEEKRRNAKCIGLWGVRENNGMERALAPITWTSEVESVGDPLKRGEEKRRKSFLNRSFAKSGEDRVVLT